MSRRLVAVIVAAHLLSGCGRDSEVASGTAAIDPPDADAVRLSIRSVQSQTKDSVIWAKYSCDFEGKPMLSIAIGHEDPESNGRDELSIGSGWVEPLPRAIGDQFLSALSVAFGAAVPKGVAKTGKLGFNAFLLGDRLARGTASTGKTFVGGFVEHPAGPWKLFKLFMGPDDELELYLNVNERDRVIDLLPKDPEYAPRLLAAFSAMFVGEEKLRLEGLQE